MPELLCLSVFTFGSGFMLTIGCKKEILFWGGDVKVKVSLQNLF